MENQYSVGIRPRIRSHNSEITISPYSDANQSVGLPQLEAIEVESGSTPSDSISSEHSQTNVKQCKPSLKPAIICEELDFISVICAPVNTVEKPTILSNALPPFQRIFPNLNRLTNSIIANTETHTTTISNTGCAPRRFKSPNSDQRTKAHNQATRNN